MVVTWNYSFGEYIMILSGKAKKKNCVILTSSTLVLTHLLNMTSFAQKIDSYMFATHIATCLSLNIKLMECTLAIKLVECSLSGTIKHMFYLIIMIMTDNNWWSYFCGPERTVQVHIDFVTLWSNFYCEFWTKIFFFFKCNLFLCLYQILYMIYDLALFTKIGWI